MEKKLDINNMNGITEEEDKTCGLNDMNCLEGEEDKTCGLNDMNCVEEEEDKTCGLNDMNCLGEEQEERKAVAYRRGAQTDMNPSGAPNGGPCFTWFRNQWGKRCPHLVQPIK